MAFEFKLRRWVEFADTDMAGIVHFSNYFRYVECAEHAFFHSLGAELHARTDGATRGFVRVHAECRYTHPLSYPDPFVVHLAVRAKHAKALEYAFALRRLEERDAEAQSGELVAYGSLVVVCVARPAAAPRLRAIAIPDDIAARIDVAPPELIQSLTIGAPR